jgi:hypothetical protein
MTGEASHGWRFARRRYDILVLNPETDLVSGVEGKSSIAGLFRINMNRLAFDTLTVAGNGTTTARGYQNLPISGVMYSGVCFACRPNAAWSSAVLLATLNYLQIPHGVSYRGNP